MPLSDGSSGRIVRDDSVRVLVAGPLRGHDIHDSLSPTGEDVGSGENRGKRDCTGRILS